MRILTATLLCVLLAVSLLVAACGLGDSPTSPDTVAVVTATHPDASVEEGTEVVSRRYQGVVINTTGRGIPGALLTFGRGRIETRVRADDWGRFDMSVPVDTDRTCWSLVAAAPGYWEREEFLPASGRTGLELVLKESEYRASVSLRVLMPDGSPAPGAWVSIPNGPISKERIGAPHTLTDWFPNRGTTNDEGCFVTHGILVGDVPIRAQTGVFVAQPVVPVTWPETRTDVQLRHGRAIRGRVCVECGTEDCGDTHVVRLRFWNQQSMAYWPTLRTSVQAMGQGGASFEIRGAPVRGLRLVADASCGKRVELEIPAGSGRGTVDLGEVVLSESAK